MKKLLILLLVLVLGCSSANTSIDMTIYKEYYEALDNNLVFRDSSSNYSTSFEVTTVEDGSHRYYVIIDNPKIAMYDCTVLVREDIISYNTQNKMMPSSGIFDTKYSLVPNQIDTDNGFPKGIVLGGEIDSEHFVVDVLVEWRDTSRANVTREFLRFEY